jgi:hypothetical protein
MNTKYVQKKHQKLILELKYLYVDLEYHEDIFKDAQEEFKEAFYEYSAKNNLGYKKPQEQKPTNISNSTDISTFVEEEREQEEEQIPHNTDSLPDLQFEKEEVDTDFNSIFKKIAHLTHPDLHNKMDSEEARRKKTEMFLKAKKAVDNKNWFELCQIAMDLDIKLPEPTKQHLKWLEDEITRTKERIQKITTTFAWSWYNDEERREQIMRSYMSVITKGK